MRVRRRAAKVNRSKPAALAQRGTPVNDMPKISQEMIKVYDDYTHLTLDRRDFMQKLTRLAGSAAAAAAIVPMLEAAQARAAIVAEDDARLKAETITWPGAEGPR